jgi:hypothetical protein
MRKFWWEKVSGVRQGVLAALVRSRGPRRHEVVANRLAVQEPLAQMAQLAFHMRRRN